MRVIVEDEARQFDQQTHAYAEYRAFSGLTGTDGSIEDVTVTLTRRSAGADEDDGRVVCEIAVRRGSGEVAHAGAVARHAYAAIDRAVSLIRRTPSIVAGTPADASNDVRTPRRARCGPKGSRRSARVPTS